MRFVAYFWTCFHIALGRSVHGVCGIWDGVLKVKIYRGASVYIYVSI